MTLEIPVFDTEAVLVWLEWHDRPPADPEELRRLWNQLISDALAANYHIELLEAALMERRLA